MSQAAALLSENLEAAYRIGTRLLGAQRHLADTVPLAEGTRVDDLDEDVIVWIDAFLKRWENFQDVVDGQVARGLVILEGESERVVTRRDRARLLEKLGLVDSAAAWFDAGELRNRLVHSYPLSHPKQIRRINAAWERTELLAGTFDRIRERVLAAGLAQVGVPPLLVRAS